MNSSDSYKGSCDTLDDLSCSLYAFYKTDETNLNALKITFTGRFKVDQEWDIMISIYFYIERFVYKTA